MSEELKIYITAELDELKKELQKGRQEVEKFGEEGEKGFSKFGDAAKKVGSAVKTGLKVASVAISAAAAGVAALTKAAVQNYAEYEQLVGGVETLFGTSADEVQKYAANAYKTAGLSANQYMETVTSFSASLLQSLGGDTAEAAKVGDMAITDMADNANKMGTSMESIQNAYQGFAKQNYTMLDNLKLGYGGTKEEMERLLQDAEKLTGVKYDINNLSDVYSAIHAIQDELGITGTTAKEAGSTIAGSVAMAQSAWTNLLTGIADDNADFEGLVGNFVESVGTAAGNLLPRIEIAINGISQLITTLVPEIVAQLPSLIENTLPNLLSAGISVITALIQGIVQAAPSIVTAIVEIIPQVIEGLVQGVTLIVEALPSLIETIAAALPELLPQLINGLVSLIILLCENFASIIQPIIDNLPDIIMSIVNALLDNLPALIQGVIDLVVGIVDATGQIIEVLVPMIPDIVMAIVKALWESLPTLLGGVWDVLGSILDLIWSLVVSIWDYLGECWDNITSVLGSVGSWIYDNVIAPVKDFFKGLWDSITSIFKSVGTWFSGKFKEAVDKIKSVFGGIKSFFSGIWDSIKSIFSKVGSTIGGAITNTVKTAINKVLSTAIGIINGFISAINTAIGIINKIPGVSLSKLKKLDVPQLAKGGIVDSATLAVIGEQGKEAIMPLENNTEWIDTLADKLSARNNPTTPIVLNVDGKTFAQTSINTINDLTRQTGSLKLNVI